MKIDYFLAGFLQNMSFEKRRPPMRPFLKKFGHPFCMTDTFLYKLTVQKLFFLLHKHCKEEIFVATHFIINNNK